MVERRRASRNLWKIVCQKKGFKVYQYAGYLRRQRGGARPPATGRFVWLFRGRGERRLLLICETTEICYFRQNTGKLLPVPIPEDPFENIHYVDKSFFTRKIGGHPVNASRGYHPSIHSPDADKRLYRATAFRI